MARATLAVIAVWALANLLWVGRDVLFIAFFAILVASFLSIFVEPMEKKLGMPRPLASALVLLVVLGLLVALSFLAWPTLQAQLGLIRDQLPHTLERIGTWLDRQYEAAAGQFGRPTPEVREQIYTRVNAELMGLVAGAVPLLNTIVGGVAGFLIVVFAGLYLSIEPGLYSRGLALLIPRRGRPALERALADVASTLRRWMLGQALGMLMIGVLTTAGLWLLDIPAALALGLIAALLEFIPFFGPILSAIPAVAIGLAISPGKALAVLLLYLVIQQVESNLVMPMIMKGVVELPPALTVLFQVLMAIMFGFVGLLLGVPLLAAAKILIERLYIDKVTEPDGAPAVQTAG